MKNILVFLFAVLLCLTMQAQELSLTRGLLFDKYYQGEDQIKKKELRAIISKDRQANVYLRKAINADRVRIIGLLAWAGLFTWFAVETVGTKKFATVPFIGSFVAIGVARVNKYDARKKREKAINEYNKRFDTGMLKITMSGNGIGLVLRF